MPGKHARRRPRDLAGYLEAISRAVFSAGISWRVVEAKWSGIREALANFDPERLAELDAKDIDALMADQRVIRNRGKLEGTVDNAQTILELDSEFGGFRLYLHSHGSYDATVADLKRQFRFLGDSGAYFFLWSVGEPVPDHEEWEAARSARSKRRSKTQASSRR
jgi:3-methyladenine DNA glycosylase Tag